VRVLAEHETIVGAVEARDESAALAALHAHCHTSEYVLTDQTPVSPAHAQVVSCFNKSQQRHLYWREALAPAWALLNELS